MTRPNRYCNIGTQYGLEANLAAKLQGDKSSAPFHLNIDAAWPVNKLVVFGHA